MNKNQGFSLIEITVSLFIITATFLGLYQVFISSISSLTKSEVNSRAYFLAQDAMEAVKNIRDRKWDEIENLNLEQAYYPEHQGSEWQLASGSETIDSYARSIIFENVLRNESGEIVKTSGPGITIDTNMRKATVTVAWTGKHGPKQAVLTNYLVNWDYMNSFVSYFTQTNKSDYTANTNTNTDINIQPGNVLLARDSLYQEFFEDYDAGDDPDDWTDTEHQHGTGEDDNFEIFDDGSNKYFGTDTSGNDIHTHYTLPDAYNWSNYEVSGRMKLTNASGGGVGLTFFSHWPTETKYYLFSTQKGNPCSKADDNQRSFCIGDYNSPLTADGVDDRDTEVVPVVGEWYRFRLQVKHINDQALIVAKAWADGGLEPDSWQVDCFDKYEDGEVGDGYISSGTIGFWTKGGGDKFFDDIVVRNLGDYLSPGTMESIVLDTGATSNFGEISWESDVPEYTTLQFQIRTALTALLIDSAPWCGPDSCEPVDDYYQTDSTGEVINPIHDGDQFIQYKAILTTTDTDLSPVLREVNISYAAL